MVSSDVGLAPVVTDPGCAHPPVGVARSAANGAGVRRPQLAAQVSHDMRTPLTSIIAGLELLEQELEETPSPTVRTLLETTSRAAARMLRMLDHAMDIDLLTEAPGYAEVDLGAVVDLVAHDVAPLLERAGATVEIGPLPVVRAGHDEMYSVLQNLLSNAVKFARPGTPPRVTIRAAQVPCGWRVSVSDNGSGIPAEHRTDVFTLFSRVDPAVEGHGIGLGAVACIVHARGGQVGADEAPGGGAEVWFELPGSTRA